MRLRDMKRSVVADEGDLEVHHGNTDRKFSVK